MPRVVFFLCYYSSFDSTELHFLKTVLQVNDPRMVEEPMEEGEPAPGQVSTQVNLVNIICSI